ncbi:uncharacterized protein LOC129883713 [Solanum dulcamara]|uniref:uncharacterized protein LOC129883713 n=1 Tax=Solanum dulcamara TaxID=45834 RepID=UPI002486B96D|nr:uncharacterized protein LOC129883713 [Solanum dulcamara]
MIILLSCLIKQQELYSWKVNAVGKKEGGLYLLLKRLIHKVDYDEENTAAAVNQVHSGVKELDIKLWYQRLGHVSPIILTRIFAMNKQSMCKVFKCLVCPYAK